MIKGDLHIHTDVSDGSLTSETAIRLAKENGMTHIAITNHDTVKNLKEAIEIGQAEGIKVIPGIEISAYDYKRNRKVHLLGYGFDLQGINITKLCRSLLEKRNEVSLKQCEIIKNLGYDLDLKKIKEYAKNSGVVYKQHIMKELIDKKYTDKIYSNLYTYLFKGDGPCNIQVDYIDVFDAIDAIKKDNGIVVVAHPGQQNSYEIIEELIDKGLDGIEKYHISHNDEDLEKIEKLAMEYNLIVTGGSDFHGEYGTEKTIGSYLAPNESIQLIFNKMLIKLT